MSNIKETNTINSQKQNQARRENRRKNSHKKLGKKSFKEKVKSREERMRRVSNSAKMPKSGIKCVH